ncbi:hypothetical protein [Paenibacillus sp. GSMTC-2017]|uniref:hypothetical protein n=1 Tax=Paenibacillus sp. GSMTC-2017 TaxID=2794350 RepID=UPI001E5D5862|nr:hypothetical protein [Paenibacillus sp. GSMTC-2017]
MLYSEPFRRGGLNIKSFINIKTKALTIKLFAQANVFIEIMEYQQIGLQSKKSNS